MGTVLMIQFPTEMVSRRTVPMIRKTIENMNKKSNYKDSRPPPVGLAKASQA